MHLSLKLPQFGGHIQFESGEESILSEENTAFWSIKNRLFRWCARLVRLQNRQSIAKEIGTQFMIG